MAEVADMMRDIAELHRTAAELRKAAAALHHITRRGGTLYTRTKATPTDSAATYLAKAKAAMTSAQRFINRAALSPVWANLWADIYNTTEAGMEAAAEDEATDNVEWFQIFPTSENAPLQK